MLPHSISIWKGLFPFKTSNSIRNGREIYWVRLYPVLSDLLCDNFANFEFRSRSPIRSLLLANALTRFRSELKDDEGVIDVDSVEELLGQAKAFGSPAPRNSRLSTSLNRLEPILSHINDFAAVVAIYSGADPKATGLVWGSLRAILAV